MSNHNKSILGILYGTELFGRERENIECYKTIKALDWKVRVLGSYREPEGGAVGKELTKHGILAGLLPFGSHFSISYFRTIKGYTKRQIQRIWNCSRILLKHIQMHQPDAVLIGSHTEFLYVWPALTWNRIKVIYRVEDGPIWDSQFHKFVMKRLLKRADKIAVCSHFIAAECEKLDVRCKPKTQVIWNIAPAFGSDSPLALMSPNSAQEQLHIVYVGQMTEKKGVRVLIAALKQIKSKVSFKCRIVGGSHFSSTFEKEMQSLVHSLGMSDCIIFTGRVPDPSPHYAWANLHVAPSLYEEPFGLVIAEAKRAGIPSIVFPRGGMPELVTHQKNGWICREATEDNLAHALIQCAVAPLYEWGTAAYDHHMQAFSQERFSQDWMQLLNRIDT